MNHALALHPIRRVHEESGVRYNIENFETLAVEKSYFGNPAYREIFRDYVPETFIDLGCNSGIFPCVLAHFSGGKPLRGVCIDASATQVALASKTIQLNQWDDVHVFQGLVGAKNPAKETADFYLHPTSLGSSQYSYADSESGIPPAWQPTEVPVIKVSALWKKMMADTTCDCLKIDIEGSEMNFLQQEKECLMKVRSVLVEWHAWTTSRLEITKLLSAQCFSLVRIIEDTPRHGILFFRKNLPTESGT